MRHATSAALDELEPFLQRVREIPWLAEKRRGIFYRRSKAFLHFHEDAAGLFADVRVHDEFERFRVQTIEERESVLRFILSMAER